MGGSASHYEELGVAPGASEAELRAAWRRAARERHPDAGGDPAAFRRAAEAYAALSGGRAGRGRAAAGPAPSGWDGVLDGLGGWPDSPRFGRSGGRAARARLTVTPEEAAAGASKRVVLEVPGRPARAVVDVAVPAGARLPMEARFPGMGGPSGGGWADLVVSVSLSPRGAAGRRAGL